MAASAPSSGMGGSVVGAVSCPSVAASSGTGGSPSSCCGRPSRCPDAARPRVGLGSRCTPARGGFEQHPTQAVEPHLRPGVRVAAGDGERPVAERLARGEADRDTGRNPERPHHRRIGAGELFAVSDLVPQESFHRVVAVPLLDLQAVGEVVLEPVLQRTCRLVGVRRAGRHLLCQRGGVGGEAIGKLDVDRVGRGERCRRGEHGRIESRRFGDHVEAVAPRQPAGRRDSVDERRVERQSGRRGGRIGRHGQLRPAEPDDPHVLRDLDVRRPGGQRAAVGVADVVVRRPPDIAVELRQGGRAPVRLGVGADDDHLDGRVG